MPNAPLTPVFTNAAGELFSHPGVYALLRYRAGATAVAAFSELLTRAAALLLAHGWDHLLSNALELPPLPVETKAWMVTQWIGGRIPRPRVLHVAVVQPTAVLARLSTSEMQSQAQGRTHYYHFATEAEAHAFVAAR